MERKSHFYATTNARGDKTIVHKDRLNSNVDDFKPISLESILRYYKLAYGIEIFILPCWDESVKGDTLRLSGYTYSISKNRQFTHSLWNKVILNNLSPKKDSSEKELKSISPCYPTQELALVGAIKYINDRENTIFFDNNGYTYSNGNGFGIRHIPHFTPFVVLTDDDVNIIEVFSFNNENERYYSVSNKDKQIIVSLYGSSLSIADSTDNTLIGRFVYPIDNEEYGNYLLKEFKVENE